MRVSDWKYSTTLKNLPGIAISGRFFIYI